MSSAGYNFQQIVEQARLAAELPGVRAAVAGAAGTGGLAQQVWEDMERSQKLWRAMTRTLGDATVRSLTEPSIYGNTLITGGIARELAEFNRLQTASEAAIRAASEYGMFGRLASREIEKLSGPSRMSGDVGGVAGALARLNSEFAGPSAALQRALLGLDTPALAGFNRELLATLAVEPTDAFPDDLALTAEQIQAEGTESSIESRRLVTLLVFLWGRFWENTRKEASEAGVVSFLALISFAWAVADHLDGEQFSNETRAQMEEVLSSLNDLRQSVTQALTNDKDAALEMLEALPSAHTVRNARVRETPSRKGAIVDRLAEGSKVGVVTARGRWRQVLYRVGLTSQIKHGWIYASLLAEPPRNDIRD